MKQAPIAIDEQGNTLIPKEQWQVGEVYYFFGKPRQVMPGYKAKLVSDEYSPVKTPAKEDTPTVKWNNTNYEKYNVIANKIDELNSKLKSDPTVDKRAVTRDRDYLLEKLKEVKPFAAAETQELQRLRSGESKIETAGAIGEGLGYVASTLPFQNTASKVPVAGQLAVGAIGEIGGEIGKGLGEDIASWITGIKKGHAVEEVARLKGYPDDYQIRAIINTPEQLQAKNEQGLTPLDSIKQLPPEYKEHILSKYQAGDPDRIRIWSALYGQPETYNDLAMAYGKKIDRPEELAKEMAVSGLIEVASAGAGKALKGITAAESVKGAFMDKPLISETAKQTMEDIGVQIPYAQQYLPKKKGLNYISWMKEPENPLNELYRQNTGKVLDASKDIQQQLVSQVDTMLKNKKYAEAIKTARNIQGQIGDDIADITALKLKMAMDGVSGIDADATIEALVQAGKTKSDLLKMNTAKLVEEAKNYVPDFNLIPKAERVRNLQVILREAKQRNKDYVDALYDTVRDIADDTVVDLGAMDEQIDGVIQKYFNASPLGQKAKGSAIKAVEAELGDDSAIRSAIEPLLNRGELPFNELHQLRMMLDDAFPKNNNKQIAALSEIREIITNKMADAAESSGFKNEFKAANDAYIQYATQRNSKILNKIMTDEGLEEGFARSLINGEGNYQILSDMMEKMTPRKKAEFSTVMRNVALDKLVGSSSPETVYNNMGRDIQSLLKGDYNKIMGAIETQKQALLTNKENINILEDSISQLQKAIESNNNIGMQAKQKLISITNKYKNTPTGTALDPNSMKLAIEQELSKYDNGTSLLQDIISREQMEGLRDFAEGASAAMGEKVKVGIADNPLEHAKSFLDYSVISFRPTKFASAMGYIAAMTGRQKAIARKLIDPANKGVIKETTEAIKSGKSWYSKLPLGLSEGGSQLVQKYGQNTRRVALQYFREAYKEDTGNEIPAEELIKINDFLRHMENEK